MSLETLRSNLPSITGIKTTLGMAPSLPKTFKAAVFKEKGQPFTLEDVELKYPAEGEILIKVLACGICGTDDVVQSGAMGNPLYVSTKVQWSTIINRVPQTLDPWT